MCASRFRSFIIENVFTFLITFSTANHRPPEPDHTVHRPPLWLVFCAKCERNPKLKAEKSAFKANGLFRLVRLMAHSGTAARPLAVTVRLANRTWIHLDHHSWNPLDSLVTRRWVDRRPRTQLAYPSAVAHTHTRKHTHLT